MLQKLAKFAQTYSAPNLFYFTCADGYKLTREKYITVCLCFRRRKKVETGETVPRKCGHYNW